MIEFLSYGFIQRALITGSFIAVVCSALGVFLVLRRLSLIGDGLAHVTFAGVAVGLLFRASPLYVAVPVVMASSLGILKLAEKARIFGDAAIGIVSALGIAIGVMLASIAGGFNVDLFSYLFGNILAISEGEVVLAVILSLVVVLGIRLFYYELVSIAFDEESARASGISTRSINTVLVLLTALTVCLAMRVVGILLISSLLILPPVTALQLSKGFRSTIFIAAGVSVLAVVSGITISYFVDLPTGATIVVLNFVFFFVAFVARHSGRRQ